MFEMISVGRVIIAVGIALVIFGLIVLLLGRFTGGRGAPLPGDIVIRRDGITIYFPIITMLVISIILTIVFWVVSLLRR